MIAVFFNLLANASFSLLIGLACVLGCIRLLRIEPGPWKLFLLSLPFVKVLYDFAQGVPRSSILITNIDPFSLPPGVQRLSVGLGMGNFGPQLKALFTIQDAFGNQYGASIGDYLVYWIARNLGYEIPVYMVYAASTVAVGLLARRLLLWSKFEIQRRHDRKKASLYQIQKLWFRSVDIYISHAFSGTPFTGGVLKPYICLPKDAVETLSESELQAVIAHEIAHVRQFDLFGTMFIAIVGDLFWFVPGYRWLCRRLERLREVIADQRAVKSGVRPTDLASALIKLKELSIANESMIFYAAFFREESLLKLRLKNLLGESVQNPPRWVWRNIWCRLLVTFWLIGAVLNSNLGGNHATRTVSGEDSIHIFSGFAGRSS